MEVARLLGFEKSGRSLAAGRHSAGKLIGIRRGNRYVYPGFQFDRPARKVHPSIFGLLKGAKEVGWGEEALTIWLASHSGYFDGDRPVDHLGESALVEKFRNAATVGW